MLTFWQRIPETKAKFDYYKEWREIAAIPITNFDHWWNTQISAKTRNMVRKSAKLGVKIIEAEFSDELIRGIVEIFNDSPVRRGKPFWHFGKDFPTVKRDLSADLEQAIFVAAYYESELIGFIKLLLADEYAMITLILDKHVHRNKSPMNGMIAKAVEICAERKVAYLTYTVWRRGDHGDFQKRNGFEKVGVPQYYIPLTALGRCALYLGAHKGLKGLLPDKLIELFLDLRSKWYRFKFADSSGTGRSV